jgi:hypothetical protein
MPPNAVRVLIPNGAIADGIVEPLPAGCGV